MLRSVVIRNNKDTRKSNTIIQCYNNYSHPLKPPPVVAVCPVEPKGEEKAAVDPKEPPPLAGAVEPKAGLLPKPAVAPNPGDAPNEGLLPNDGALPNPPEI